MEETQKIPDQVTSYWISLDEVTGVYSLMINTLDRWLAYGAISNTEFYIGSDIDSREEVYNFSIKPFLPELPRFHQYVRTDMQDKDQITFYWIPVGFRRETHLEHWSRHSQTVKP